MTHIENKDLRITIFEGLGTMIFAYGVGCAALGAKDISSPPNAVLVLMLIARGVGTMRRDYRWALESFALRSRARVQRIKIYLCQHAWPICWCLSWSYSFLARDGQNSDTGSRYLRWYPGKLVNIKILH